MCRNFLNTSVENTPAFFIVYFPHNPSGIPRLLISPFISFSLQLLCRVLSSVLNTYNFRIISKPLTFFWISAIDIISTSGRHLSLSLSLSRFDDKGGDIIQREENDKEKNTFLPNKRENPVGLLGPKFFFSRWVLSRRTSCDHFFTIYTTRYQINELV